MSNILEDLFSLKGKTALVTGGAKGLGAMISAALSRAGCKVIIVSSSRCLRVPPFMACREIHSLFSSMIYRRCRA